MNLTIKLLSIFLFFYTSTFSQINSINNFEDFIQKVRVEPSKNFMIPNFTQIDENLLIKHLVNYRLDSISQVRKYTYQIANQFYYFTDNNKIKQKIITLISTGLTDKNSGNCGIVCEYLKNYSFQDFNSDSKKNIHNSVTISMHHIQHIIKLIGYLKTENSHNTLINILTSNKFKSKEVKWAAQLALARLGDDYYTNVCLNFIKSLDVNDDLIYDFLPDLIYIKQKAGIDYLIEILMNNEKNCESADPESTEMILCSYRVMEYLAPIIKDFPLKINASGDIETQNYREALNICREWFLQNRNYQIITTIY